MPLLHRQSIVIYSLVVVAVMVALPATVIASTSAATPDAPGIVSPTHYRSPQFGYDVTWTDPWHLPEGAGTVLASTEPRRWDRLVLLHGSDRGDVPVTMVTAFVEIVGERVDADAGSPSERWHALLDFWKSPDYAGGATVTILFASVDDSALVVLMSIDDHLRLVQVTPFADGTWDLTVELRGRAPVIPERFESAVAAIEIDGQVLFSHVEPVIVACLGTAAATPVPGSCQ